MRSFFGLLGNFLDCALPDTLTCNTVGFSHLFTCLLDITHQYDVSPHGTVDGCTVAQAHQPRVTGLVLEYR